MAATRLKIYNGALLKIGQRAIADLSVNEESRRLLDQTWADGGVQWALEQGQWTFAMRASKFSYDTGITPSFGYHRAFAKPSDYVETCAVCSDEYFRAPLLGYSDETGFWFADLDEIYVKYVSNDANYGNNLSLWPQGFTNMVEWYFAWTVCLKLTGDRELFNQIQDPIHSNRGYLPAARLNAKNRDAMAGPTTFPARGSWNRAHRGSRQGGWNDGGNRGSLIG